jgi:tRNA pseudouridine55 synthase
MAAHEKAYNGEIVLGADTDTDDAEGRVVAEAPVPPTTPEVLRDLEARFTGELLQRPPAYSALKTGGRRAYDIARGGGDPALVARPVRVFELQLTQLAPARLRIDVRCGAGTYIRSLARDIGEALGCGAHLGALRRTAAGSFTVEEAWPLPDIERLADADTVADALIAPDEGVLELPAAILGLEHRRHLEQGKLVAVPSGARSTAIRLYDTTGEFAGIGAASEGLLRARKMLFA